LPKWGWALIIILINIVGPVIFLIVGKKKDKENDEERLKKDREYD